MNRNYLSILIALFLLTPPQAFGYEAKHGMWNYADNDPCPDVYAGKNATELDQKEKDRASHTAEYCSQMRGNDIAVQNTMPLAIGYTAVAVTCGLGCTSGWTGFGASLEVPCEIGSLAAGAADFVVSLASKSAIEDRNKDSKAILGKDWGLLGVSNAAVGGAALGLTLNAGSASFNAARAAGTAGSLSTASNTAQGGVTAAGDKAATAGLELEKAKDAADAAQKAVDAQQAGSANASIGGTVANDAKDGVTAAEGNLEKARNGLQEAQKAADEAKTAADQAKTGAQQAQNAEKSANSKKTAGMCVAFAMNTIQATIKWINFATILSDSADLYNKMCDIQADKSVCEGKKNIDLKKPQLAMAPQTTTSSSSMNGAPPGSPGAGLQNVTDLPAKVDHHVQSGKFAQGLATASAMPGLDKPSPEGMKKALGALQNMMGVTPGQIAGAVTTQGLGGAMSAMMGHDPKVKDLVDALADRARLMTGGGNLAFESNSRGSGGGGGGNKQGNPFAGFGNRETAALGGTTSVSFGGFDGDIWHAGSTKSIFEIVSERTNRVAHRVQ